MVSAHVVLLSNDVVPGQAVPVAAPGLRVWGLQEGLKAHGVRVDTFVVEHVVDGRWSRHVPAPVQRGVRLLRARKVGRFLDTHRPDALVVTNSNYLDEIDTGGVSRVVYDFFAPKMLELAYQGEDGAYPLQRLQQLRRRKIRSLERADAVIVNGRKKLPYVYGWLLQTDRDVRGIPVATVNMCLPPMIEEPAPGTVRVAVSGYLQPWSKPGPWADALVPLLDEGACALDLMVASHWGGDEETPLHPGFRALIEHPTVEARSALPFSEFRAILARAHVSVDLFTWNLEREHAMVTRSVVALATGVPVVHPPFTEVAPLIREYDAGWLVDPDDPEAIAELLRGIVEEPELIRSRRKGARRLASEVLDPEVAVRPLLDIIDVETG